MSSAKRVARELAHIQAEGVSSSVYIAARGGDLTTLDALLVGPPDTPYDGAMLCFRIKVPSDYPMKPPQVKFLSTDGGTLRIHPQLYADGKVCLSILGTWHGPEWSPTLSLRSVLLSIQSLMNEEPLTCEPGFENSSRDAIERANIFVTHEVARVLILRELSGVPTWGSSEEASVFTAAMRTHLAARRLPLLRKLQAHAERYDGKVLLDPFEFGLRRGVRRFDFASLASRLVELLPPGAPGADAPLSASSGRRDADAGAAPRAPRRRAPQRRGGVSRGEARERPEDSGCGEGTEGAGEEAACCRICHQSEQESGEALIRPCMCSGSIEHAHSHCLLGWLRHSAAPAPGAWRCDICRSTFRMRYASGIWGSALLRRRLDRFAESDTEAPGLIAVMLVSFVQTSTTSVGRACGQTLLALASLLGGVVSVPAGALISSIPVIIIDLMTVGLYVALVFLKVAIAVSGSAWTPSSWGAWGEESVGVMLGAVADSLGWTLGMRIDGLMLMCGSSSLMHLWYLVYSQPLSVAVWRLIQGGGLPEMLDTGPPLPGIALHAFLPEALVLPLATIFRYVCVTSLVMNISAIGFMLKCAYLDRRPIPVDILPWTSGQPPATETGTQGGQLRRRTGA